MNGFGIKFKGSSEALKKIEEIGVKTQSLGQEINSLNNNYFYKFGDSPASTAVEKGSQTYLKYKN